MLKPTATMDSSPAYTWYFLAMAHHQLGNKNAAKEWLDKAVGWTEKVLREHEEGTSATNSWLWNRRLTLKLLRQEAETLIGLGEENHKDTTDTTDTKDTKDTKKEATAG